MKEKIGVAIGSFFPMNGNLVCAFNRCAELLVDGKGLLDEAWENFRS